MTDPKQLAAELRKVAADLRNRAMTSEKTKTEKIAKILVAARGLSELKRILSNETVGE
jgi:hypothetical protein